MTPKVASTTEKTTPCLTSSTALHDGDPGIWLYLLLRRNVTIRCSSVIRNWCESSQVASWIKSSVVFDLTRLSNSSWMKEGECYRGTLWNLKGIDREKNNVSGSTSYPTTEQGFCRQGRKEKQACSPLFAVLGHTMDIHWDTQYATIGHCQ